jgi:type IV pilus assembly protein PilO
MAFYDPLWDQWTLLSAAKKTLVAAAGVVLVALVLGWFWIRPLWEQQAILQEDIDRLQVRLTQIRKTVAQIEQFKKELQEIDVQIKRISTILPETREIPELLKGISNLGQQNGLEFLLFKPEKENPREFVAEIPVEVNLKGHYHQMGLFFDQVRRQARLVNVRQLEMGGYDEKTSQITARCRLVTYTVLPDGPPGAGPVAGSAPAPAAAASKAPTAETEIKKP